MITECYRYPDVGDCVTASFIRQHEPFPGYWEASERRAFGRLERQLAGMLPARGQVNALDAGCGDGRLLPWLSQFAATLTAADPDIDRLASARGRLPELVEGTAVSFAAVPITALRPGSFTLVICSHVLQHVPTGDVFPILRQLRRITAPGAALMLAYSRAPVGRGGYSIDRLEHGVVHSRSVGRQEFDRALTGEPQRDTLPVRKIDPEELEQVAAVAGWVPRWEWTYHVLDGLGSLPAGTDRDELTNNSTALRQDLGRDIVTLWHRDDDQNSGV